MCSERRQKTLFTVLGALGRDRDCTAIVRNLLDHRPSLLSEALADAAEYKQFKYNFVQELLKQKEELLSRQTSLTFALPDESYKTPNHTNIWNNYEY